GKQEVVVTAGPVGGPVGGPAVRRAGPGIGTAMTPAAGTPAVTGRRTRLRLGKDPVGADDPTQVQRAPGDRPDDPTEVAPPRDPTTFAPAPPPPANR
ncbi:MAG TPA: hypothetical protein VK507_06895, partial [Iamia sp.]|nr:hypothetical protein [Iamia sp.]